MNKIATLVNENVPATGTTPYGVARLLNIIADQHGLNPTRPQMMYNYARNGMLVPNEKLHGPTLRPITPAEVEAFLTKWCTKHKIEFDVVDRDDTDEEAAGYEMTLLDLVDAD